MSEAAELVAERERTHGDAIQNMVQIAQIWSAILHTEVQPWQVPLCMAGLKLSRASNTPEYRDHTDDVDGYIEVFRTVMGEDLR